MAEEPIVTVPTVEDIRGRVEEMRGNIQDRIAEWRERGWRPEKPILGQVRRKGVLSKLRTRVQERLRGQVGGRSRGQAGSPEEIEPAYAKGRAVKEEAEVTPTTAKREIAIEI